MPTKILALMNDYTPEAMAASGSKNSPAAYHAAGLPS